MKKKLTQKLNSHDRKDKKVCKKCKPIKDELNLLNRTWRNGHLLLKRRFAATKPGLIHGIHHEKDNQWRIQMKYRSKTNTTRTEYYVVDTAYVVKTFGKEFAAFALQNNTNENCDFIDTPKKVVSVNDKTIQKVKYVKEKKVMKLVPFNDKFELHNKQKKGKKPVYNESLLAGEMLRPRKKNENVGDQVGKERDEPDKIKHRYPIRDPENPPEQPTHKEIYGYREVPTEM